jgi:hypothetical protein
VTGPVPCACHRRGTTTRRKLKLWNRGTLALVRGGSEWVGSARFRGERRTELFNRVSSSHEAGFYVGDSPNATVTVLGNESFDNM